MLVQKKHIVKIKATHSGYVNGNNVLYPAMDMNAAAKTWLEPYAKPILRHHDKHSDAIGRVIDAKYIPTLGAGDGYPNGYIELTAEINDEVAAEKIKNRIYTTVSIGADAGTVSCSHCDQNIVEDGLCEHIRGKVYDGKKAYWNVGELKYTECSYVNRPADEYVETDSIEEVIGDGIPILNQNDKKSKGMNLQFDDSTLNPDDDSNTNEDENMTLEDMLQTQEIKDHISAKVGSATAEANAKVAGFTALDEKCKTQEGAITVKDTEIETLKAEVAELTTSTETLRDDLHKNLVDKVFDRQKALLKKLVMDLKDEKEEVAYKADLAKRTDESLTDTISDLSKETLPEPVGEIKPEDSGETETDAEGKTIENISDEKEKTRSDEVKELFFKD